MIADLSLQQLLHGLAEGQCCSGRDSRSDIDNVTRVACLQERAAALATGQHLKQSIGSDGQCMDVKLHHPDFEYFALRQTPF